MKRVSLLVFICVSLFVFLLEIIDSNKQEKILVAPEVFSVDSIASDNIVNLNFPENQLVRRTTR